MNGLKTIIRPLYQKLMGKITYEVNKIIKKARKNNTDYNVQREEILDGLKNFYSDQNNYTDVDLKQHKEFLYSQREGLLNVIWSEIWESWKSAMLGLLAMIFSVLFISNKFTMLTDTSEIFKEINMLEQSAYTVMGTLVCWIVIVILIKGVMILRGRKYRKYKIVEYELTIIDMLQEKYNEEVRQSVSEHLMHRRQNNNGTP